MKKIYRLIIVLTLLVGCALTSNAQFSIGPRVGIAVNKLRFNEGLFDSDNQAGFTGGLEAEFMIPAVNLGVDLSVLYVRRNSQFMAQYETTDANTQEVVKAKNDYIDIPLYLKWKIGLPLVGKIVTPYVFTGPDFAFLTSKTAINEAWNNKKVDVAWNFGLGVQLFSHLQVGASYGIGMSKAAEKVGVTGGQQEIQGKNRYWTVTAAWLF